MRLHKINLIGKTVLVNLEQIAFIEKDPDTHNAVITMGSGDRFQTNEDCDEFTSNIAGELGQNQGIYDLE
jgi:uncharacterized protein YlzI (FlbEa/FlbD family)